MDFVDFTVQLLGKSRLDDLRRLRGSSAGSAEGGGLSERGKRLAVYRAIRTQVGGGGNGVEVLGGRRCWVGLSGLGRG